MTRKEEIINAAYNEAEVERQLKMHPQVFEQGFVAGAKWADAHPDIDVRTMAGLLQPIPLTSEILKKNFPSTTDWYFIGTDKFCFRIDKYKDKWDLYFGRDGKGTNLQIKISYVHELQHALRLCGINKEIEI